MASLKSMLGYNWFFTSSIPSVDKMFFDRVLLNLPVCPTQIFTHYSMIYENNAFSFLYNDGTEQKEILSCRSHLEKLYFYTKILQLFLHYLIFSVCILQILYIRWQGKKLYTKKELIISLFILMTLQKNFAL